MKRMFDKEEIVDIIQEESPKVEVDSELSETSENPVQNKVIYEALQNVGSGKYLHILHFSILHNNIKDYLSDIIVNENASLTLDDYKAYLATFTSSNYRRVESCKIPNAGSGSNKIEEYEVYGLYISNNNLHIKANVAVIAYTISNDAVVISVTNTGAFDTVVSNIDAFYDEAYQL